MNFGKSLELIRKQKGYSQEELSFIVGVSRQTIYTWEAEIASPNLLMLKKLAKALDITIDELINGPSIEVLPKKMKEYILEYVSDHEPVTTTGILNWFIKLEVGNELSFGLYDDGLKDYSYHLTVLNQIMIHNLCGYEVLVEQYNKDMIKDKTYSLVAKCENNKMQFLAKIETIDGIKKILTFKDKEFVNDWGEVTSTYFDNAKNYLLKYGDKEYKAIQISYFVDENIYVECYLDEKLETLLWRRFDKDRPSSEIRIINNITYGYFYESITDLLR